MCSILDAAQVLKDAARHAELLEETEKARRAHDSVQMKLGSQRGRRRQRPVTGLAPDTATPARGLAPSASATPEPPPQPAEPLEANPVRAYGGSPSQPPSPSIMLETARMEREARAERREARNSMFAAIGAIAGVIAALGTVIAAIGALH